jgi:hypothetical protein
MDDPHRNRKDALVWIEIAVLVAIRDRLQHTALILTITGESYRGVKARKLAGSRPDQ